MGETKEQSNEAVKKEVEGKAKQINSIDDQTAAVNVENKIVDFDYVLNNNQDLAFRINNIQKLGFSMDYIKRLVSIKSDFSIGDAESVLEDEIEKVFNSLVRAITEDKNGIILNADGTIDEEASEIERAELGILDDIYAQSYLLSKEKEGNIFKEVFNTIKENEGKLNVWEYLPNARGSILDELPVVSNKDIEDYYKNRNLSNEYDKSSKDEEKVYIRDMDDLNVLDAIYKFEKEMEENPTAERQAQMLAELREIAKKNNSKLSDELLDESEEFDVEKVHNVRKEFEDTRNKTDVRRELEQYVHIIGFRNFPNEDKEKIARILIRALKYKDDPMIVSLLEDISNNFKINVLSFDELKKIIKETTGRDIREDKVDEFNSETEFNLKNSERKLGLIRTDLIENPDKQGMSAQEARAQSEQRDKEKRNYDTLSKKMSYMAITSEIEKAFSEGDKEAIFEVISIYVNFNYSKNPDDIKYQKLLKEYIQVNYDYLKKFFDDNYPELNVFNSSNKTLNVKQMKNELENHHFSEEGQKRIENIVDIIKGYSQKEEDSYDQKVVNEISSLISENLRNFTEVNENKLVMLLSRVNPYILNDTMLDNLKLIKSDLISKTVEKKFTEVYRMEGFSNNQYSKENVKLNFLNLLEENVLILETKLENAKGKPDYLSILEECKRTYAENPYYEAIVSKYRDSDGNLTDYANEKFEEYNDGIIKEAIEHNLKNNEEVLRLSGEEKDRYVSFLLVGLEINSLSIQGKCVKQLQSLYSVANELQGEDFRNYIYQKIFGDEYVDISQINKQREKLKSNVLSQAIKAKNFIDTDKILDSELENAFSKKFVEMNVTEIDFSKSEFENLFNNSKINFTSDDEKSFQNFFESAMRSSFPMDKLDALKQHFLVAYSYKKEAETNKNIIIDSKRVEEKMNTLLEENPELKGMIFDENGDIPKELLDANQKFKTAIIYSELLNTGKQLLENQQVYEDMSNLEKAKLLEVGILLCELSRNSSFKQRTKDVLEKFSSAILEKANSPERQIVKFDENGNPRIQENEWQKEYKSVGKIKEKNFSETYKEIYNKYGIYKMFGITSKYRRMTDEDFKDVETIQHGMEFHKLLNFKFDLQDKMKARDNEIATKLTINRRYSAIQEEVLKLNSTDIGKVKNPYLLAVWYEQKINNTTNDNEKLKIDQLFKQKTNADKGIEETISELKDKMSKSSMKGRSADRKEIINMLGEGAFENVIKINKDNIKNQIFDSDAQMQNDNTLISDISSFDKEMIDEQDNLVLSAIWYNKAIMDANRRNQHDTAVSLAVSFHSKFPEQNLKIAIEDIKESISQIIDNKYISSNDINENDIRKELLGEDIYRFVNNNKGINKKCDKDEQKIFDDSLDELLNKKDKDTRITCLASLYKRCLVSENTGMNQTNRTMHFENYMLERKEEFKEFFNEDGTIDFKEFTKRGKDLSENKLENFSTKLNSEYSDLRRKNYFLKQKTEFVSSHIGKTKNPKESKRFYEGLKEILDINEKCIQNGEEPVISYEMNRELQEKESSNYFKAITRNSQKKQDKWTDYVKTTVRLGGIALKQLPKIISGKESRSEFFDRIIEHTTNGMERIAGKVQNDFNNLLGGNIKTNNNVLESADKMALPEGGRNEEVSKSKVIEGQNQNDNKIESVSYKSLNGLDGIKIENSGGQLEKAAISVASKQILNGQETSLDSEEIGEI